VPVTAALLTRRVGWERRAGRLVAVVILASALYAASDAILRLRHPSDPRQLGAPAVDPTIGLAFAAGTARVAARTWTSLHPHDHDPLWANDHAGPRTRVCRVSCQYTRMFGVARHWRAAPHPQLPPAQTLVRPRPPLARPRE
jgi:hypothetical protein